MQSVGGEGDERLPDVIGNVLPAECGDHGQAVVGGDSEDGLGHAVNLAVAVVLHEHVITRARDERIGVSCGQRPHGVRRQPGVVVPRSTGRDQQPRLVARGLRPHGLAGQLRLLAIAAIGRDQQGPRVGGRLGLERFVVHGGQDLRAADRVDGHSRSGAPT